MAIDYVYFYSNEFAKLIIRYQTVEISDPDEFTLQAPTMESFPKKVFSPNRFCGKTMSNYHREDFDSILLI